VTRAVNPRLVVCAESQSLTWSDADVFFEGVERSSVTPRIFMATTTIEASANVVTLVNVFETTPDKQDELIQLLERATVEVVKHQPGFVSANIHRGLDGKHVANYAQWKTKDDFERMLKNPEAQHHMGKANALAKAAPVLYRVASVHQSG
jgi:heme-degrading monooxygenase HmoA